MPSTKIRINLTVSEDIYQRILAYKKENGLHHDATACLQLIVQQLNAQEKVKWMYKITNSMPIAELKKLSEEGMEAFMDAYKNQEKEKDKHKNK